MVPADTAGPWAPVSATGLLVHDTLSARVHPQQASAALAAAVTAMGGEITDTPPGDRPYQTVDIDPDTNVVPDSLPTERDAQRARDREP